jgi:hypothetical protein
MPKSRNIKGYSLQIGFTDKTTLSLSPSTTISKYNFSEYEVDMEAYAKLQSTQFDMISFNKDTVMEPCVSIKTKDYFVKFLNELK